MYGALESEAAKKERSARGCRRRARTCQLLLQESEMYTYIFYRK